MATAKKKAPRKTTSRGPSGGAKKRTAASSSKPRGSKTAKATKTTKRKKAKKARRPAKKTAAKVKSRAQARKASRKAKDSGSKDRLPSPRSSEAILSLEKSPVSQVILERQLSGSPRSGTPGVTFLGLDLGTRRTVIAASRAGGPVHLERDVFPTAVGVAPRGVDIAGNTRFVFGDDAIELQRYVDLAWPVDGGVVRDMELCRKFVSFLGEKLGSSRRLWAVASTPAGSTDEQRSRLRQVLLGALDRVFVVPEPYLAAVGMLRDDGAKRSGLSVESALHSLVVDVGSHSTRLCLLEGGFPERNDQLRLDFGGSAVDEHVISVARLQSGVELHPDLVRSIKEEQGIVDVAERDDGGAGSELLDLVYALNEACEQLLCRIVEATQELLERRDVDSVSDFAQTIVLTGGSSRIPGIKPRFEALLEECDLGSCRVLAPDDHERLAARGALHVAEALSDEEWGTADVERRLQDWEPDDERERERLESPLRSPEEHDEEHEAEPEEEAVPW